jgi:hypothetical protein
MNTFRAAGSEPDPATADATTGAASGSSPVAGGGRRQRRQLAENGSQGGGGRPRPPGGPGRAIASGAGGDSPPAGDSESDGLATLDSGLGQPPLQWRHGGNSLNHRFITGRASGASESQPQSSES